MKTMLEILYYVRTEANKRNLEIAKTISDSNNIVCEASYVQGLGFSIYWLLDVNLELPDRKNGKDTVRVRKLFIDSEVIYVYCNNWQNPDFHYYYGGYSINKFKIILPDYLQKRLIKDCYRLLKYFKRRIGERYA